MAFKKSGLGLEKSRWSCYITGRDYSTPVRSLAFHNLTAQYPNLPFGFLMIM